MWLEVIYGKGGGVWVMAWEDDAFFFEMGNMKKEKKRHGDTPVFCWGTLLYKFLGMGTLGVCYYYYFYNFAFWGGHGIAFLLYFMGKVRAWYYGIA